MTTIEKVKSIQDIARKNGLSLNKKFTDSYLTSHSMFSGPQVLADRIVGAMWDMCTHGINNGFDGSCKSAMDSLSDIVVKLTEVGDEQIGKLGKFSEKADAILKKEFASRKDGINVTEPLSKCAASCLEAIDTMIELNGRGYLKNTDEAQRKLLEESRDIINQLVTELKDVSDTSSVEAQACADAAIEAMNKWRLACAKNMLTQPAVQNLKTALDKVKEWSKLVVVVGKKNRAKEDHRFVDDDDLTSIVESKGALEIIDTFLRRMDSEKQEIDGTRKEIDEYREGQRKKLDECNAEIDALEAEKQAVLNQFENGEIDQITASRKVKEIKAKMDEPLYRKGVLEEQREEDSPYYDLQIELEIRENIYQELLAITTKLNMYKKDLVFLVDAIRGVDFYALVDMLDGSLNDNSDEALKSIHRVAMAFEARIDAITKRKEDITADRQRRQSMTGQRISTREEIIERQRAKREQADGELDADILAIMQKRQQGQQQQQQTGDQTEQPVKRKTVALSGEDL